MIEIEKFGWELVTKDKSANCGDCHGAHLNASKSQEYDGMEYALEVGQ